MVSPLSRVSRWLQGNPYPSVQIEPSAPTLPVITTDMMMSAFSSSPVRAAFHDGDKFPGGFGETSILTLDYWSLRQRSQTMFRQNIYARGIVRRLVTNIINTGLNLEAVPDESVLGVDEDALADVAEMIENRFHLWERSPALCDYKGASSFGTIQAFAKQAALISGDVLCILHQDANTGLPLVRLVDGNRVQSPFGAGPNEPALAKGHAIKHGVELDADGRHIAYWITSDVGTERKVQRLPRIGPTGRRNAWLVYGTDKLLDDVRGEPILSIMLQSLKEIDRYRDSIQRKAVVNSVLAMFIKKDQEVMGSRPMAGGAVRRGSEAVATGPAEKPRVLNFADYAPGLILDELAPGESPEGFRPDGTDEKFADFEAAIIYGLAWSLEIPPEILTLSFNKAYSASQAGINEFKLYLNPVRAAWGDDFCQPIYNEWLLAEVLSGRVKADGLLDSWRDPARFDEYAAWVSADWTGAIKPSVDLLKQANGYGKLVEQGFMSRDRAARETTGQKFSKNVKKLKRENEALAAANKPIVELEAAAKTPAPVAPAAPSKRDLTVVPKTKESKEEDN